MCYTSQSLKCIRSEAGGPHYRLLLQPPELSRLLKQKATFIASSVDLPQAVLRSAYRRTL